MTTTQNPADLTDRLTALQKAVAAADRERAQAETTLQHAQRELAEVEAELRKLGVDPERAEETLAALEADLATKVEAFERAVVAERKVYADICAAAGLR